MTRLERDPGVYYIQIIETLDKQNSSGKAIHVVNP